MRYVAISTLLSLLSITSLAQSNPVPQISFPLVPTSTAPGGRAFTLTVNGAGFTSGAVVNWNGQPRSTQFVTRTQLKAQILASDIASAGTTSVTVTNPGVHANSNVAFFSVTLPVTTVAFEGSNFPTSGNPEYLAAADFNGDGIMDLAIANWTANNSLAILLGNGNGTFQPVSLFPTGDASPGLAIGDFNGDGKLDIATVDTYSNTLSIVLGNGDGTFQPPINYATSQNANSIVAGDFNGDGKLDLAVGSFSSPGVSIYLGNGDGTFKPGSTVDLGAFGLCTADFNGDGILDLAAVNYAFTAVVVVSLGNGDGTFQDPVAYASGPEPSSVVAADLNGDGILDLVTGDNDGASVLLGSGDGSFGPPTIYLTGGSFADAATVADFNGDGIPDIAVGNETADTISVLLGNGDGTFQQSTTYFQSGISAFSLAAADFNNDGAMDIALTAYGSSNSGGGVYASLQTNGPAVLFSQAAVTFPTQLTGSSNTISLSLTNVGKESLGITQIGMTGAQARDFSQTNNCGSNLSVGGGCNVNVTFTPRNKGPRIAALVVQDNAINRQQSIPLSGTGTWMNLSPSSLDFGNQKVGTDSKMKNVTLTNTGTGPVTISEIGLENQNRPQFAFQSSGCGNLAAGASCTVGIQFTPTLTGEQTNILGVKDNGGGVLQQTTLSGNGVN